MHTQRSPLLWKQHKWMGPMGSDPVLRVRGDWLWLWHSEGSSPRPLRNPQKRHVECMEQWAKTWVAQVWLQALLTEANRTNFSIRFYNTHPPLWDMLSIEFLWQPATPLTMDDKIHLTIIPTISRGLDGVYELNSNRCRSYVAAEKCPSCFQCSACGVASF